MWLVYRRIHRALSDDPLLSCKWATLTQLAVKQTINKIHEIVDETTQMKGAIRFISDKEFDQISIANKLASVETLIAARATKAASRKRTKGTMQCGGPKQKQQRLTVATSNSNQLFTYGALRELSITI